MKRHLVTFFVGLLLFQVAATAADRQFDLPDVSADEAGQLSPLAKSVQNAREFLRYEGLPHPQFQNDQFRDEMGNKKTLKIEGFDFYERPLALRPADAASLKRLVVSPASYRGHVEGKLCGDFHPDYGFVWKGPTETYHI